MAKTLANINAQVRTYLDETVQADWTDVEVNREINVGYMKVYTAVVGVFEDYYSVKSTASSVADQQEYDLPSDFYKVRRIEINYKPSDSNTIPLKAIPIQMDSVRRDLGYSTQGMTVAGTPSYYIRGDKLGFIPFPTVAGSDAITLWYIKIISELSSNTDAIDIPFPDRYYDSIALEASGTLLRKSQQEEEVAKVYLQDAEMRRMKMVEELEDRQADDSKMIVDTQGDDVDFSSPGI